MAPSRSATVDFRIEGVLGMKKHGAVVDLVVSPKDIVTRNKITGRESNHPLLLDTARAGSVLRAAEDCRKRGGNSKSTCCKLVKSCEHVMSAGEPSSATMSSNEMEANYRFQPRVETCVAGGCVRDASSLQVKCVATLETSDEDASAQELNACGVVGLGGELISARDWRGEGASVCFADGGRVVLGSGALTDDGGNWVNYTGEKLEILSKGGFVFSSSSEGRDAPVKCSIQSLSAHSRLSGNVLARVKQELLLALKSKNARVWRSFSDPGSLMCFRFSSYSDAEALPTLRFALEDGTQFTFEPARYLYETADGSRCIGIISSLEETNCVLGLNLLHGLDLRVDYRNRRVSLAAGEVCAGLARGTLQIDSRFATLVAKEDGLRVFARSAGSFLVGLAVGIVLCLVAARFGASARRRLKGWATPTGKIPTSSETRRRQEERKRRWITFAPTAQVADESLPNEESSFVQDSSHSEDLEVAKESDSEGIEMTSGERERRDG